MLTGLTDILFRIIFFALRWISNLILLPLTSVLRLFPGLTDFESLALQFFDDYVLRAVAFGREVFLNMTGFPQELITLSVQFALGIISAILILKAITFVSNMWRTFKGGGTGG